MLLLLLKISGQSNAMVSEESSRKRRIAEKSSRKQNELGQQTLEKLFVLTMQNN